MKFILSIICIITIGAFVFIIQLPSANGHLSFLTIRETLDIAQHSQLDEMFRPMHPKAWRGNPEALPRLYQLIEQTSEMDKKAALVGYIGFIGTSSDIEKLMALLPKDNSILTDVDEIYTYNIMVSLMVLALKGEIKAEQILAEMAKLEFWEARKISSKSFEEQYKNVRNMQVHALGLSAFLGTDIIEDVLKNTLKQSSEQERNILEKQFKDSITTVEIELKRLGIWKVRMSSLEISAQLSKTVKVPKHFDDADLSDDDLYALLLDRNTSAVLIEKHVDILIQRILNVDDGITYIETCKKVGQETLDKLCDDLKQDVHGAEVSNKILFLGITGAKKEITFLTEHLKTYCGQTLDTDRVNEIAAILTALAMMSADTNSWAHPVLITLSDPLYWKNCDIKLPYEVIPNESVLQAQNGLTYSCMVAWYMSEFYLGSAFEKTAKKRIKGDDSQFEIVRQLIEQHYLPFREQSVNNVKNEIYGSGRMLKIKLYEEICKILSGPVSVERLAGREQSRRNSPVEKFGKEAGKV